MITTEMIKSIIEYNRECGIDYDPQPLHIRIPFAKESLQLVLSEVIHHEVKWLPQYDEVAKWLADNQGKSLILLGPPGVGKTEIAMKAIPLLFHCVLKKIVSRYKATDICREEIYRSLMHNDLIVIDDFGIEGMFNDYGNPHIVFSEVVDNIECKGGLLIATTNLTLDEIHIKYGLRTIDRLRGNTKLVVFTVESMRGMYEKVY